MGEKDWERKRGREREGEKEGGEAKKIKTRRKRDEMKTKTEKSSGDDAHRSTHLTENQLSRAMANSM